MDIQEVKNRYKDAYIEDFGDYEIVHVDKKELEWLIEQTEKYQKLEDAWKRQQAFGFMKRCSEIID